MIGGDVAPRLVLIADIGSVGPEVVALTARVLEALGEVARDVCVIERDITGTSDRLRLTRLMALRAATRAADVALVVHARCDLAMAAGADGVQLPERGLPPRVVRRAFPSLAVGRSCHDRAGLVRAAEDGADWALLAPLHLPHSKPSEGPVLGHAGFRTALDGVALAVYALGGVTPADMGPIRAARGAGLATIGGVFGAPDPVAAAQAFLGAG